MMVLAYMQQIELPVSGEQAPIALVAAVLAYVVLPNLTTNLTKWDAEPATKARVAIVLAVLTAVSLEFAAGDPTVSSLLTSVSAALGFQYVGFKQLHSALAAGAEKPTVGAISALKDFGFGKSSVQEED